MTTQRESWKLQRPFKHMELQSSYFSRYSDMMRKVFYMLIPIAAILYESAIMSTWFGKALPTDSFPFSTYSFWLVGPLSFYLYYQHLQESQLAKSEPLKIDITFIEKNGKFLSSIIIKTLFILGPAVFLAGSLRPRIYATAAGTAINLIGVLVYLTYGTLYTAHSRVYNRCKSIDQNKRFEFHAARLTFFFFAALALINLFIKTQVLPQNTQGFWSAINLQIPSKILIPMGIALFVSGIILNSLRFFTQKPAGSVLDRTALSLLIGGVALSIIHAYPQFHELLHKQNSPEVLGLALVYLLFVSGGFGLVLSLDPNPHSKVVGSGMALLFAQILQLYAGLYLWGFAISELGLSPVISFIGVFVCITLMHGLPGLSLVQHQKS